MNSFKNNILERIRKIGNFFSSSFMTKKIVLIALGIASTIWFLFRVIPKPSRASYPCMRAAAPLMSSFVLYILGFTVTTVIFKKAKETFRQSKYFITGSLIIGGLLIGFVTIIQYSEPSIAYETGTLENPNSPMGEGTGIFPGRVVWVHNPNATNETMKNIKGDFWTADKNANQDTISKMLSQGIQSMTGTTTDAAAWDSIFHYYNRNHAKGETGYTAGEKIVIKLNLNGLGNGMGDAAKKNVNTSPQICYAILDQLVNVAGVAQADISIGDPNVDMDQVTYNKIHTKFPNVKTWGSGTYGKPVTKSTKVELYASDKSYEDYIPQEYVDAAYMINMPVFKKHHRAGISIACKNHFGSMAPFTEGAWHLHPSLPSPEASGTAANGSYGVYRCFVDIMGHKDLGGKTILYLVDGIWGSINWGHPCVKFRIAPFNNDWPSSLFLSQDPVAVESVCLDFLRAEFEYSHPTEGVFVGDSKGPFPQFAGVDDYLHQAADPANWPANIQYDPEKDGTVLKGMGTHEHWNDSINKQYSRNLGLNKGIELYKPNNTDAPVAIKSAETSGFKLKQNYPNPAKINTTIGFYLPTEANVQISIYNIKGQLVTNLVNGSYNSGNHDVIWNINNCKSGYYVSKMTITTNKQKFDLTQKIQVQ